MPKSPGPAVGKLLVSRTPRTDFITLTWPDGQTRTIVWSEREGRRKLINFGVPPEKIDKVMNYVYNMYHAYIEGEFESPAPLPAK